MDPVLRGDVQHPRDLRKAGRVGLPRTDHRCHQRGKDPHGVDPDGLHLGVVPADAALVELFPQVWGPPRERVVVIAAPGNDGPGIRAFHETPAITAHADDIDTHDCLHGIFIPVRVRAHFYQQFDADVSRDVPGESFGGWKSEEIDLSSRHTAVVVMHAWDTGTAGEYPGWYRAVEYLTRANEIGRTVLPGLLSATRKAGFPVFHVVAGGDYYRKLPGYLRAVKLAAPEPPEPPRIAADPSLEELRRFRRVRISVGAHNEEDVKRGFDHIGFMPSAVPDGEEGVAENSHQLFALCREIGVNHLIYAGFAINWCLLMSPGGMVDMERRGIMCSTFRQAVTALENRESARKELAKQLALWRVSLGFGFVFDVEDFISGIGASP